MRSPSDRYQDDELLALSGLQHLAFCERQWALIHLEQIWEDSADTLRGDYFHERVDAAGYSCSDDIKAERGVRLVNRRLGIYGIADIVERSTGDAGLLVCPVEYKVGRPKVEDWDCVQVTAQALCLEEMLGVSIAEGALFYGETRRRERVDITQELRDRVETLAARMHELFSSSITPRAEMGTRCRCCSLVNECLPEVGSLTAHDYWAQNGEEALA